MPMNTVGIFYPVIADELGVQTTEISAWMAIVTGYPFAACLSVGPATLVNRWFNERVGLILGLTASCSALGGVVFMLLGQAIIE